MRNLAWHHIQSNDSHKTLFFFLIAPSIITLGLLIPLSISVKSQEYQRIFLITYLLFSFPHFAISFTSAFLKKTSIDIKNYKPTYAFLICIAIGSFLFAKLPTEQLFFIFIPMIAYQSWHYSMQNFGISHYFINENKMKHTLKFLCLLIGGLFFLNLLTLILEHIDTHAMTTLSSIAFIFKYVILALCLFMTFKFGFNAYKLDKKSAWGFANIYVWLLWACFSTNGVMLLALPVLHSVQYLPFTYKQTKSSRLNISHVIFEYLFWLIFICFIYYGFSLIEDKNMSQKIMKFFFAGSLIANSAHIFIDSLIWRRN